MHEHASDRVGTGFERANAEGMEPARAVAPVKAEIDGAGQARPQRIQGTKADRAKRMLKGKLGVVEADFSSFSHQQSVSQQDEDRGASALALIRGQLQALCRAEARVSAPPQIESVCRQGIALLPWQNKREIRLRTGLSASCALRCGLGPRPRVPFDTQRAHGSFQRALFVSSSSRRFGIGRGARWSRREGSACLTRF